MSNPKVLYLDNNSRGHDFVVGDVHGCFAQLTRLLAHVGFDYRCDRLFAVGRGFAVL